ncbi:hypothetical protein HU200_049241 [Digitaria exilis]|uniref:NADP-dependent oxidoreductase domain-containing protein n=1 Tax=Digitaria exilis TaxID=1010633 RepID=A0A835AQV6_9POAL|nr:hypothetical protein HU200_049241 [Digitaria exilis]
MILFLLDCISKTHFGTQIVDFSSVSYEGIFVEQALQHLPREKVQIATKFGIAGFDVSGMLVKGTPDYVRACCEASLQRLAVDYIDLYYQHRVDQSVPIEQTMGELKKLVEEGKVKYVGLSEASADTIRRAHAVHPITAVQLEWSLWTRDIEEDIIPVCRSIQSLSHVHVTLFSTFFLKKMLSTLCFSLWYNSIFPLELMRVALIRMISSYGMSMYHIWCIWQIGSDEVFLFTSKHPRYTGENLEKNKILYTRLRVLSKKYGCTPAQLALSWVLHQGQDVVPIPGTTKLKNLDDNIGAVKVKLNKEDVEEISSVVPAGEVSGSRLLGVLEPYSWRLANTPLPK